MAGILGRSASPAAASKQVVATMDAARRQLGIGVVVPFDFALDRELWRWAPEGVSLYVTRTSHLAVPVSVEMAEELRDEPAIRQATIDVLAAEPGVVVYACTSASYVGGTAGERRLCDWMAASGAPKALTTSGALLDALQAVDARRVAVATPYTEPLTARLVDFLAAAGHDVVAVSWLGMEERIAWVSDDSVRQLVRAAYTPEADAVVISCTNLPTYDVICDLEDELDRPLLSANLVTMWAALGAVSAVTSGRPERLFRVTDSAASGTTATGRT